MLEISEQMLPNQFFLLDAIYNSLRPLNIIRVADLALLRALLTVCKNSRKVNVWEAINCVALLAYASDVASGTFLKQLIVNLNLPLNLINRFILLVKTKLKYP